MMSLRHDIQINYAHILTANVYVCTNSSFPFTYHHSSTCLKTNTNIKTKISKRTKNTIKMFET